MSDAWEILQGKSSGTGDAWDMLTHITGGGSVPGAAVNEIPFALTGAVDFTFAVADQSITGNISQANVTASVAITEATADLTPENFTITEGC